MTERVGRDDVSSASLFHVLVSLDRGSWIVMSGLEDNLARLRHAQARVGLDLDLIGEATTMIVRC